MKSVSVLRFFKFLVLTVLVSSQSLSAQSFLKADGKKIVDEQGNEVILKGMGLGGWMLMEGYMMTTAGSAGTQHELKEKITELVGREGMEAFYDAWLANHVTKADIDTLAAWGFNSVRLPMHYDLYTPPIEEEPELGQITWREKGFILTDSLLSWCAANEMYLVLDLHAAPGGQGYDEPISDRDPDKPSLWENPLNQDKTVALWRKLAERYVDEPWMGGYDLINETNWNMDNNALLRNLYDRIVTEIREVDTNHIIYIEGNWFANDFTGLTPPFDDNMVYSFHKYWSYNNQDAIQWVLDIRDDYNVPLWLGESGENSNTWFRDCIKLMKTHGIGWAWWPMKKLETISGPLSITKNAGFQQIIDYWDGNGGKPSSEQAMDALMTLAEDAKIENCRFNPDVIHAMFDQIGSDATRPYTELKIPGIIYATDFDIGPERVTYFDQDIANYQVSTGTYTSWNNGWVYRNDGVDIQASEDDVNSNGYNIAWFEGGEWMKYTVDVEKTGYYTVDIRAASESSGGKYHFEVNDAQVGTTAEVPSTGGWQNWKTVSARGLYLEEGKQVIKFIAELPGCNIGSFDFRFLSVTGVEDQLNEQAIRIYPNPGLGKFVLKSSETINGYQLINASGKIIESRNINNMFGTNLELDFNSHKPGMYLLRIESDNSISTHKIIIK